MGHKAELCRIANIPHLTSRTFAYLSRLADISFIDRQ